MLLTWVIVQCVKGYTKLSKFIEINNTLMNYCSIKTEITTQRASKKTLSMAIYLNYTKL